MNLHIHNISKTYPNGVQALKGVSLTIPAGMYGLLGPNGAGKSTRQLLDWKEREDDNNLERVKIDSRSRTTSRSAAVAPVP